MTNEDIKTHPANNLLKNRILDDAVFIGVSIVCVCNREYEIEI